MTTRNLTSPLGLTFLLNNLAMVGQHTIFIHNHITLPSNPPNLIYKATHHHTKLDFRPRLFQFSLRNKLTMVKLDPLMRLVPTVTMAPDKATTRYIPDKVGIIVPYRTSNSSRTSPQMRKAASVGCVVATLRKRPKKA